MAEVTGVREAADTAPRDLSTKIVKAYHARDEDAFVRNLISLVAAAERADTAEEDAASWKAQVTHNLVRAEAAEAKAATLEAALADIAAGRWAVAAPEYTGGAGVRKFARAALAAAGETS